MVLSPIAWSAFDDASEQALRILAESAEPIEWVEVAGACFTMGDARAYPEETPPREMCVEHFSVSKHEITNAQFARFVLETGYVTRAERGWLRATMALSASLRSARFRPTALGSLS